MTKTTKIAAIVASITLLSACTPPASNSNVYTQNQTMQAASVQYGTITSGRYVEVRNMQGNNDAVAGAVAGGLLGALAGDQFGKGRGNTIMTGAGAIAGASLGSNYSKNANRSMAQEWIVQLDSGRSIAVAQDDQSLSVGSRVSVIESGAQTRLVRAQ